MASAGFLEAVVLADEFGTTYVAGSSVMTDVPLFYVVFDKIAPAANKYMATLFNTSVTRKIQIRNIYRLNWQVTAVSGVSVEQYLARITARTAGTVVAINSNDTNITLSSGISADTNSSAVTESHIVRRFFAVDEEVGSAVAGSTPNVPDYIGYGLDGNLNRIYEKSVGTTGIILRQNQGISIRNVTASVVGSVSYIIEFTDEVA